MQCLDTMHGTLLASIAVAVSQQGRQHQGMMLACKGYIQGASLVAAAIALHASQRILKHQCITCN